MEELAPKKQLLVTSENITEIVNKIMVKKSDIKDPRIIDNLRHLCEIAEKRKDSKITLAVFIARKEVLEEAGEIYATNGIDSLFEESTKELDVILEILKEHTITR